MKMLKSVAEQKYFDTITSCGPAGNPIDDNGVFSVITDMVQGNTKNDRIGDRISLSSIEIQFTSYCPIPGGVYAYQWKFRLIIFVWKDDTTPTLADILENVTWPTLSPFNHDAKVKRKILYDKVFDSNLINYLDGNNDVSAATGENVSFTRKIILPAKLWRKYSNVYFQSATATAVNHVYWLAVSEVAVAANTWSLDIYTRCNYIDL